MEMDREFNGKCTRPPWDEEGDGSNLNGFFSQKHTKPMGQDLGPHALESQQNGINEEYDDFWDT